MAQFDRYGVTHGDLDIRKNGAGKHIFCATDQKPGAKHIQYFFSRRHSGARACASPESITPGLSVSVSLGAMDSGLAGKSPRPGMTALRVTGELGVELPPHPEYPEIDRFSHGEVAGAVRMKPVARAAGGAFGNELRLYLAGRRVECDSIKVRNRIEYAR